jgi:hypothetical protein
LPLVFKKLFCTSKFFQSAVVKTLNSEDIKSIRHDIKSYEKELIRMGDMLHLPHLKEIKHFLTFEEMQEGIRLSKAVRRFYSRIKLTEGQNKIDFLVSKILECNKNK